MNLKKFTGPAILVGISILLIVVVQAGLGAKYEDGDTLDAVSYTHLTLPTSDLV